MQSIQSGDHLHPENAIVTHSVIGPVGSTYICTGNQKEKKRI
jgi:hypothetical protein